MRSRTIVLTGAIAVAMATAAAPAGSSQVHGDPITSAGRFVVLMAADPVAAYDGGVRGLRATSPAPGRTLRPRSQPVQRYARFLRRQHTRAQRAAGVAAADVTARYTFALNGFAAELSTSEAEALRRQPRVVAVVRDRLRQLQTDNTPEFLGLSGANGPWASDIVGEDVVVGVIDSGIWPEHPSFADDGTFGPLPGRPPVPCQIGNSAHNPDDVPFTCNDKLLGARDMRLTYNEVIGPETYDSARDDDGHGTHTASTAAGNSEVEAEIFGLNRGEVSGVAPRARVIAYKACGEQGCFESDLAGAIDRAVADGVDVINYSIGGGAGLGGADELAFLIAGEAGVFAATSAGNEGPGPDTVGGPASAPWVTAVGASTQDRTFEGALRLGDGTQLTGASVTPGTAQLPLLDAEDLGNELCLLDTDFSAPVTDSIVLCRRGENARVDKSRAVFEAGGAGMVLYDVDDAASLVTDNHWVPAVHINNSDGLVVKQFIDAEGAAAAARIRAGQAAPSQGSVMADFSSRGPNPAAADIIKPDITAPGVNILAGNSPTPVLGSPGELFQSISGTSMSSPHIAGVYALIKQAHPDWTPAMAKSAIMTTARQNVTKENGTNAAAPFDFGAGHVRPGSTGASSVFDPGLVYDAGLGDYLAFMCGSDPSIFANPTQACAALSAEFSTDASDLNQPAIGVAAIAGTQRVTRRITSVAAGSGPTTYTASVDAPAGFLARVVPRRVVLAPGESATFRVVFRNTGSARLGRWVFGSLTWRGGGHRVRSPIAVAASAFDSPAVVRGTGQRGRAGFPVKFGYTGGYDARAHGLVPRRTRPGTVAQDPDQVFDPDDPAGTTAHRFRMRGTAYMRWELTHPDPAVDLDLYLVNPQGRLVASSTSGGTDELIERVLPRNGVFTLFVHGWQTVAEPREAYTLRTWQVPRSTRGNVRVVREPASAVLSRRARVGVSWAGLPARRPAWFGAVSHHRGGNVLGLTLVRVLPRG